MPITIDVADVALAIRAITDKTNIPTQIETVLQQIVDAGSALVEHHAPQAPDDILNLALIRVCGYLYEADPTRAPRGREDPLRTSGAAALLSAWRVHRAEVLNADNETDLTPSSINVPSPPISGNFALFSDEGVLTWVEFPKP